MLILTEELVLSVFTVGTAKDAVIVHAELQEKTGKKFHRSRVYPVLRSLEDQGLLESFEDFSDTERVESRGDKPVIMYQLTGSGLRRKTNGKEESGLNLGEIPQTT